MAKRSPPTGTDRLDDSTPLTAVLARWLINMARADLTWSLARGDDALSLTDAEVPGMFWHAA